MEVEVSLQDNQNSVVLEQRRKKFEEYLVAQGNKYRGSIHIQTNKIPIIDKTREQKQESKKLKDLETKDPKEKMLYIQKQFRARQSELETKIDQYRKQEISYAEVIGLHSSLKEFFLSINYALLTFDRQSYKETLDKLGATIAEIKKKLEPRRKFTFKRRDEDFGVKTTAPQASKKETESIGKEQGYQKTIPGLDGQTDLNLVVPRQQLSKPYKIVNSSNSTISLNGVTEILFLKNLKNCTVKAGPTKSTVFVDKCEGCTFDIACHQLRIHNTTKTTFGVYTTSRLIIEDTTAVVFQDYQHKYEGVQENMAQAELKGKKNLWREVQDFNWLKQEASPNFTLNETTQPTS